MITTKLGEYLISQEAINNEQLEEALRSQSAAMTHCFLGDIFVEQQVLSREDFDRLLRQYLREKAADAREEELRLGNLLLDSGKMNMWDLDAVLARQKESGGSVPLGEILVEGGFITTHELEVYLANQKIMRGTAG